jgi:protein TonB
VDTTWDFSKRFKPNPIEIGITLSLVFHFFFLGVLFYSYIHSTTDDSKHVDIQIVEKDFKVPLLTKPQAKVLPTHSSVKAKKTAVPTSGISRESTIEDKSADSAKIGNTLSKAPDNLPPSDEALPPAADDYEITSWPKLQNDVRIPYPREAKTKQIDGVVVMDLYVDERGAVRKANLVSGPGFGLNEAALSAAKQFKFSPALVGSEIVPVVIRYSYRFVIQK